MKRRELESGYTLIEVLLILAIIIMLAVAGIASFNRIDDRVRVNTSCRNTAAQLHRARLEAMKLGQPVIARVDEGTDVMTVWVNVDGDAGYEYQPDDAERFTTVDYELTRVSLPSQFGVEFRGVEAAETSGNGNGNGNGKGGTPDPDPPAGDPGLIIEGLTTATTLPNVAVFMPNGSVLDSGAIRIGDKDSNYCEVRIEPEATAKVAVLRWHAEAATPGFYP